MSAGRGKGQNFEREVARRLSLWWTDGERDDTLWRSSMSGGRATLQGKKGIVNHAQAGDISAIAGEGEALLKHIIVECKFYKNLVILQSLLQSSGRLVTFWEKHLDETLPTRREPFMVARENNTPTLLLTTARARHLLGIEQAPRLLVQGWPSTQRLGSQLQLYLFDDVIPTLKSWKR